MSLLSSFRIRMSVALVFAMSLTVSGCNSAFMHDLKPHRLWRLNRGPAPGRSTLFSVSDPIDRTPGMTLDSVR